MIYIIIENLRFQFITISIAPLHFTDL